jgi:hypothetical protein
MRKRVSRLSGLPVDQLNSKKEREGKRRMDSRLRGNDIEGSGNDIEEDKLIELF